MKKLIMAGILFSILFSFTSAYAADVLFDPFKRTIADLQEIALKNSRQALIDDVDIKRKKWWSVRSGRMAMP